VTVRYGTGGTPRDYLFQPTEIRNYQFPSLDPCALAMDLCLLNLAYDLDRLRRGNPVIVREAEITRRFKRMEMQLRVNESQSGTYHCAAGGSCDISGFCLWHPRCSTADEAPSWRRTSGLTPQDPQLSGASWISASQLQNWRGIMSLPVEVPGLDKRSRQAW